MHHDMETAAGNEANDSILDHAWRAENASRVELPRHEEALARLDYVVSRQRGFALLTGPAGSGKSELLRQFADGLQRESAQSVFVDACSCGEAELLRECCNELGLGCATDASAEMLRGVLLDAVRGRCAVGTPLVLILDHADRLDTGALRLVERLLHSRGDLAGMTLVAASRESVPSALAAIARDHADVRIELAPLTVDETETFLQSILLADRSGAEMTSTAIEGIHSRTDGDMRRINRLCRLAIDAAEVEETAAIDERMIECVSGELPA